MARPSATYEPRRPAGSVLHQIVQGHDVDDSKYRIRASEFPALVDMPAEGHGDEPGQVVMIVGKGATGTGATVQDPRGPNRTELRRAFNKITSAHGRWLLAGLSSWKVVQGDVRTARPGLYGQTACHVRLSHYIEWMESVISEQPQAGATNSFKPTPLRGAA